LDEIAIIVRSNREVEEWSKFLESNGVPAVSKKKTNILNSPYVGFILDYLSLIDNPYFDETKLVNIIRSELS
jgi:ATP-dependent exoDNAse (exonuclease V) beta subunit